MDPKGCRAKVQHKSMAKSIRWLTRDEEPSGIRRLTDQRNQGNNEPRWSWRVKGPRWIPWFQKDEMKPGDLRTRAKPEVELGNRTEPAGEDGPPETRELGYWVGPERPINWMDGTDQAGRNSTVGTWVENGWVANRSIRNSSNASSETDMATGSLWLQNGNGGKV